MVHVSKKSISNIVFVSGLLGGKSNWHVSSFFKIGTELNYDTGLSSRNIHLYVCVSCSVVSNSILTQWTLGHQASLSVEFSRQEYWSGSYSLLQEIFLYICVCGCVGVCGCGCVCITSYIFYWSWILYFLYNSCIRFPHIVN